MTLTTDERRVLGRLNDPEGTPETRVDVTGTTRSVYAVLRKLERRNLAAQTPLGWVRTYQGTLALQRRQR